MRALTMCLTAAAIAGLSSTATAQGNGAAAYIALVGTPTAGVTPAARRWMTTDASRGVGIDAQWGHVSGNGGSLDTFTGGVVVPVAEGRADFGLSAGYFKPTCDVGTCDGNLVASGVFEGRVLQSQGEHTTLTLGLSQRIGFAKPSGGTAWSASTSVPLSIAIGTNGTGIMFVPFISPGLGWGSLSGGGESASGERFMLGGGIGVMSATSGVGFNLGLQKVFISGGKTVLGAGITWTTR